MMELHPGDTLVPRYGTGRVLVLLGFNAQNDHWQAVHVSYGPMYAAHTQITIDSDVLERNWKLSGRAAS